MLSTRFFSRDTLIALLTAFTTFSSSTVASLIDNGTTITSNGIPYYSHGIPVATLNIEPVSLLESAASHGSDLFPMTIIHTDVQSFGLSELNSTFSRFSSADDVFQKGFLHSVYLTYNGTDDFKPNVASCLSEASPFGTKLFMSELPGSGNSTKAALSQPLPNGPYFVSARTGQVFQAYRLYPDDNLAFTQPSVSDHQGGHLPLTAVTENLMTRSVAVPSRLYYTATKEQPLAGLRLAVKDIFHIKGLKTSGGNRAYYYLYPEQNATGSAVQRLLDQGAVLVGKSGTVQFANGDRVTADWVDVHCPFNPRGEGYQDPSGSSSGSGAAIGAYEWLDLAVGSDTGGSMRGPAGRQGIYGNRPSTGAVSLNNVIPLSPHLDTAGVFARSASLWSEATHAWYTNYTDDYPTYPSKVYFSTEGADPESPAAELVQTFVSKLSGFLNTNYTIANISEQWAASHPANVTSSINELLNETYAILTSNDQFNLLGQPFFDDYAAQHDGRRPFINPGPLVRWQWGQNHSSSYDSAVRNMTTFKTWWSTSGYGRPSTSSCSEGIFVYASYLGTPSYRNTYFEAPSTPPLGFSTGRAAVFGGGAELVVPVGEVEYESTISLQTEWLPVVVNLLVAPGCDLVLANLVKELEEGGILRASRAGSRI